MAQEIPQKRMTGPKRKYWYGMFLALGVLLTVLILVIHAFSAEHPPNSYIAPAVQTTNLQDKINILVLGVDERGDDVGRSDTTFVVTIDTTKKQITMLSIPRDTRVKIAGHGWDKINHAYAFGGQTLAKQTIQNLLGIPIDYTILINFKGFRQIIDALGGVDINVEKRMYYADPYDDDGGLLVDLQPGLQHMDGKTAIEYVRYRDEEGDIGRVSRQQKFLQAVFQKTVSPDMILKLPELIKSVASSVRTDMPVSEMLKITPVVKDAAANGLKAEFLAGTPVYIQDVSYWLPNIKELRMLEAKIQGLVVDAKYQEITQKQVDEYEKSMPREFKYDETTAAVPAQDSVQKQPAGKVFVKVSIINASGQPHMGEKAASLLANRGFQISSVTTASVRQNTVVLLHTTDRRVIGQIGALPFDYNLQVDIHSGDKDQITIILGQDFH